MPLPEKLKKIKGLPFLLCGLFLGLVLLLLPANYGKTEKTADTGSDISAYEDEIEHRIAQMVSARISSDEVSVLVTVDCSEETVYAAGNPPLPVRTVYPKIRGIAVVCRGGDDPALQLSLISMLTAAFGLSASHVYVGGK